MNGYGCDDDDSDDIDYDGAIPPAFSPDTIIRRFLFLSSFPFFFLFFTSVRQ